MAFDVSTVSTGLKTTKGPGRATLTTSQNFRNKVWAEIEKAFSEEIYQNCKQVQNTDYNERLLYFHLEQAMILFVTEGSVTLIT